MLVEPVPELGGVLVPGFVDDPGVVLLLGGVVEGGVDDPGVVLGDDVLGVVPLGEVRTVPSLFTQGMVIPGDALDEDGFDGFAGLPG